MTWLKGADALLVPFPPGCANFMSLLQPKINLERALKQKQLVF